MSSDGIYRAAKKCFVISPIGAENSETRRHADTVFECIIKPACTGDGDETSTYFECERGDHKAAPGKITDQIYEDIMASDLIIAVLTESNPNVYYELAIAQSAAKPVILLLEKGYEAPFDIKDQRIIYYDFDPQRIFDKTYVKQLQLAIRALEGRRGRPTVPFAPDLAPLGDPMQAIYSRASDAEDDTIHLVDNAEHFIWMSGYTLNGWTMNQDFANAMARVGAGLRKDIRVMIIGPDNPTLGPSMKDDDVHATARQSAISARNGWINLFANIPDIDPDIRINNTRNVSYQIFMSEKEAIIIPYLTSRDTLRSPYIYARRESFYYEAMHEEFSFLWTYADKLSGETPSYSGKANGKSKNSSTKSKRAPSSRQAD